MGRFTATAQSMPGNLSCGGARPQKEPCGVGGGPAPAKPPGYQALRRTQETRNQGSTSEQWQDVQRRSQCPPRDISEIPLENKALLKHREILFARYVSRMRHQGPQLPNLGRPRTVGPLQAIPGARAATCPAGQGSLCPAWPPLGGTIRQGPRSKRALAAGEHRHRHILVPAPNGGGPGDPVPRRAQPPVMPHGGQAWTRHPAP